MRLRVTLLCGVIAALVVAVLVLQLLAARRHLQAGAQQLHVLRDEAHPSTLLAQAGTDALRGHLARARGEFSLARDDLHLAAPVFSRLGWIPRWGPQLVAAMPAANAGFRTSDGAIELLDALSPVLAARKGGKPATQLLVPLASMQRPLGRAVAELGQAANDARQMPARTGNGQIDRARQQLQHDLPVLRSTVQWLRAAPELLGAEKPARFLLLYQDPAELRATGGFIGAAGYLVADRGRIHSVVTSSALPREIESVAPPLPEALYTAEGPWIFRDSNWSPDFPLTARIARWFYGEDTGRWVDGVIGLQDTGIAEILNGVGPVYIPQYGVWINAGNLEATAQRYVNGVYKGPLAGAPDDVRKQFFHWVTQAMLARIQSLPFSRWPQLAQAVSQAVARRDLMMYDRRPAVAEALSGSHAGGRFAASQGDFLAIVDDNRSYNKINPYVGEETSYTARIRPDLSIDATLRIHYTVHPSPPDLEGFGPGYGALGTKHDYQDFLRVFVPRGAQFQSMAGVDQWAPAQAYGMTQFAGRMLLRQGESRTVTIRYHIPANALAPAFDRYRLTIWHQPGATLRRVHVAVEGADGVTLGPGSGSKRLTQTLSLDVDAHLTAHLHGHGDPALVRLPPLPRHPDPYIPWPDLRDPKHPL